MVLNKKYSFKQLFTENVTFNEGGAMNHKEKKTEEIIIYQTPDKKNQVEVKFEEDTVWLSQKQISLLFDKNIMTVNEHIKNIYTENELDRKSTIRKSPIVQTEGHREVKREVEQYNLDAILSVGYRVNSKRGTQFRIWATQRLKEYLVQGYSINQKRLIQAKDKINNLENLLATVKKSQEEGRIRIADSESLIQVISDYSKTFVLLNQYDTDRLVREDLNKNIIYEITYDDAMKMVRRLTIEMVNKKESTPGFGLELENRLKSILGAIPQTFGGKYLYPSVEEQAANLLYMIITGHAFREGNKRNGCLLFSWFLEKNNYRFKNSGELKFNDNGLALLALLIAQSRPQEKETYIDLIINLITNK